MRTARLRSASCCLKMSTRGRTRRGRGGASQRASSAPNTPAAPRTSAPPQNDSSSSSSSSDDEMQLVQQKVRLLEREIGRLRQAAAKRSPSPSSSSQSDSGDSSSSESSSPERRTRRKRRHSSSSRSSSAKRQWKNMSYGHQYETNTKVLRVMAKVKKCRGDKKKVMKMIKKGERILNARQEWLMIAEFYGSNAASHYEEGGELLQLVSSPGKKRRLMAALQADGARARLAEPKTKNSTVPSSQFSYQTSGPTFSAVSSAAGGASASVPPAAGSRSGACHLCGQYGHYIRCCPHSQVSGRVAVQGEQK